MRWWKKQEEQKKRARKVGNLQKCYRRFVDSNEFKKCIRRRAEICISSLTWTHDHLRRVEFFLHFLSHSSLLDRRRLSLLDRADVVIFSSSQHIESIFMSSKTILCKIAASSLFLFLSSINPPSQYIHTREVLLSVLGFIHHFFPPLWISGRLFFLSSSHTYFFPLC